MALRVMSFNMFHGAGLDGQIDLDRQGTLIRDTGADIVCLQEVDVGTRRSGRVDQARTLLGRSGLSHCVFGRARHFDDGEFGNAILSRHLLTDTRNYELPPCGPFWNREEPKALLAVSAQIDGRTHTVISTHFSSRCDETRLESARLVVNLSAQIVSPILVGGDINTTEIWDEISLIRTRLTDAFKAFEPDGSSGERVDYIFFRGPYRVTNFVEINTNVSDHNPIVADLEWVEPPPPLRSVTVTTEPYPVPVRRQVTIAVLATDTETGGAVAGTVLIDGQPRAQTNESFTYTFRPRRIRQRDPDGSWTWITINPAGTVTAAGYTETEIDFGF